MIRKLLELFRRYAAEHISVRVPGFPIHDVDDRRIGHLDIISIQHDRLHLEGWALAEQVRLRHGERLVQVVPNLPREDVRAVLAEGESHIAGFILSVSWQDLPASVSFIRGRDRITYALTLASPQELQAARRRLIVPFARALLQNLPLLLRWFRHRELSDRSAIKRALGMTDEARMNDAPIPAQLFASDQAPTDQAPADPALVAQAPISIILPVFNAFELLEEVLDRVVRHTDVPWSLIVIEDCSTDQRVRPFLRDWVREREAVQPGQVTLLENAQNQGFIRSVNLGIDLALKQRNHAVFLNSDALVPARWASRLLAPILKDARVATVTPMSNDAEIYTTPVICQRHQLQPGEADAIDAVAERLNVAAAQTDAPTGVGFCMAVNVNFLTKVGDLDTSFGRGYGEEVDWCQRARKLGGRHVGLGNLFVEHRGGTSFGSAEKLKLVQTNNATIASRYPGYDQEVQDFIKADPLSAARLALGIAWAAAHVTEPLPVYLAHSMGGGADKWLDQRLAEDVKRIGASLVLRVGGGHRWRLELHSDSGITYGFSNDLAQIRAMLDPVKSLRLTYSCGVGDGNPIGLPDALLQLKRGDHDLVEVLFHDFFPISPSYCLLDHAGWFAGVPAASDPDPAHTSRRGDGSRASLADWREAWGRLMAAATQVTVFSANSKALVLQAYPDCADRIVVIPHRVPALPEPIAPVRPAGVPGPRVLAALGNIGLQKGAGVLVDLSRKLAGNPDKRVVLIGNIDPNYTLAAGTILHGSYQLADLPELVSRYGITDWLVPSIWPETFSYVTHEALATGLPVWCFDLGAQADTVRTAPNGFVLPFKPGDDLAATILEQVFEMKTRELA